MRCPIEATRRRLRGALDQDLALYEQFVPSKELFVEYLESTKQALMQAVKDAFDEKIGTL